MGKGLFVVVLLLLLTASVGCNVYQFQRQTPTETAVAVSQESAYLKNIAERMSIEVKNGAHDCDIAADILCRLNDTESVPSEVLPRDVVKDAGAFFSPEDCKRLKAMNEFVEKIRGKRVIVLPNE